MKSSRKGSGESKKVTTEMAVSLKETILPAMLLRYQSIDIYNTDKFRLFYKDLKLTSNLIFPRVTLLMWQQSKARIIGMAVRNAISERILMFIVEKSAKPRCFKHVRELLCRYIAQNKVWMNETIFEEWLHELDGRFKRRELKILMKSIIALCTLRLQDWKSLIYSFCHQIPRPEGSWRTRNW